MRLTLRTLLAYLDDVLEPSEAKEIGRKLQESPVATALVSRLREVMRRRRIGAPDLIGPGAGIDPNLVAQYLDNSLPVELVGEVEKVCLESDQQLAEVAACHQILTLALGEPVEISASSRERLYVLGPVDQADKLQAGNEPVARGNGERTLKTPVSVKNIPGSGGPSFEQTLPEYLRPKPWSGKVLPIAVSIVLLAVWLGAMLSDRGVRETVANLRPAPVPKTPVEPIVEEETVEEVAQLPVVEPPSRPADAAQPATPTVKPPVVTEIPPADALTVIAAVTPEQPTVPQPPEPMEPVVPVLPAVAATYVSPEGVLLQQNSNDKSWYMVPRQAALKPGTRIACPEPFEAVLEIDHGAMRVTLLGNTQIELGPPTATTPLTIRLIQGRMILGVGKQNDKAWPLGFAIGERTGQLEFGEGESLCGLELLPQEPVGFEQPVSPNLFIEGMYVLGGNLRWTSDNAAAREAGKSVYLSLLTDQPALNFGPPISSAPDWLDPQRRKVESTLRRFAKQYEKEFELNQPVDSDVRALIRDPRPKISELAVRCLALIDNIPAVVQALAQAEHEDARKAAMNGLRTWLGVSVDRGVLLKQSLAANYERDDQIAALYRLLWGISVEEARMETPSFEILEWLRSDKSEIRELTFANLVRLTGRKYDYRPLATAAQREPAVKRWFEHVSKDGAILKAE